MKFKQTIASLATVVTIAGMGFGAVAFSETQPIPSYQINIQDNPELSKFPMDVTATTDGRPVSFQVMNNTSRAVYFEVPGTSRKEYIPVGSQTTVVVGTSQPTSYRLVSYDGTELYSGQIGGSGTMAMTGTTGTMTFNNDEAARTLSQIISSNSVTSTSSSETYQESTSNYQKPEPTYQASPARSSRTVRGYW